MNILDRPEYSFLKTDPRLGRNIIFLTYGGSYTYGTNVEGSDIDIRGCTLNSKADLLGMGDFEQVVDDHTDTMVYAFNKLLGLFINCSPNTIELLGCRLEHYFVLTSIGQQLLDQRKMFLSRRAVNSFGGYAGQQLRWLENALTHDAYPAQVKERHIMGSCENAMLSFPERYHTFDPAQIRLSVRGQGRRQTPGAGGYQHGAGPPAGIHRHNGGAGGDHPELRQNPPPQQKEGRRPPEQARHAPDPALSYVLGHFGERGDRDLPVDGSRPAYGHPQRTVSKGGSHLQRRFL